MIETAMSLNQRHSTSNWHTLYLLITEYHSDLKVIFHGAGKFVSEISWVRQKHSEI